MKPAKTDASGLVWHPLGEAGSFAMGIQPAEVGRVKLVLVRSEQGFRAFDRHCPHVGGPMLKCETTGSYVTCPLHGWSFNLDDGGREAHGYRSLRTYLVRLVDRQVFVELTDVTEAAKVE